MDKWIKGILSARLMHSVLERLSKYKNPELTTPYIEIRFIPLSVYPFIGLSLYRFIPLSVFLSYFFIRSLQYNPGLRSKGEITKS
jgi:hypothetical protein